MTNAFVLTGHDTGLEYHRTLLEDVVRMTAYERAIRSVVQPHHVVLDLGAGTGILSMMAARRGATVHAVESMSVGYLARELVAANGLDDRITVHVADIRTLEIPEPVDVVISDFMGRFVVDDGMLEAVDAAAKWLRPEGCFVPRHVDLRLAPVGGFFHRASDFFGAPRYGFDLSPARAYAFRTCYGAWLAPDAVMAEPQTVLQVIPGTRAPTFTFQADFDLATPGTLEGIAGWFRAELADDVILDTGPGRDTHWGQYLFPIPPMAVESGDRLHTRMWLQNVDSSAHTSVEQDAEWHWKGHVKRGDRVLQTWTLSSDQWQPVKQDRIS